jgi:hypothetical protein
VSIQARQKRLEHPTFKAWNEFNGADETMWLAIEDHIAGESFGTACMAYQHALALRTELDRLVTHLLEEKERLRCPE